MPPSASAASRASCWSSTRCPSTRFRWRLRGESAVSGPASILCLALRFGGGAQLAGEGPPAAAPRALSADRFAAHVRTLASDAFAGRGPGTEGEERTVAYLRDQLSAMGLDPVFQTVRVVGNTTDVARSTLGVVSPRTTLAIALGERAVIG